MGAMANVTPLPEKCLPTKTCMGDGTMFLGYRNRHNCTKLKDINFMNIEKAAGPPSTQE